jgi:DNA-binding MurR/RpiR family transcriptional regulator
MGKPLQQAKFNQVMRTVRDLKRVGTYSSKTVAEEHGISVTTVNFIRSAKTWKGYQAFLAAYQERRKALPEAQLDKGMKQLAKDPVEYVTKKQFTDAIDSLNGRTSAARNIATDAQKMAIESRAEAKYQGRILNRIMQLKPRWFRDN